MTHFSKLSIPISALLVLILPSAFAAEETRGIYQGVLPSVKFDESPPLRLITPVPIPRAQNIGGMMRDPDGTSKVKLGVQDRDLINQTETFGDRIPGATLSFDAMANLSGVAPPDSVGDIGPNHYVAMSNVFFEVYDRSGTSVFGPAANNTLWSGFGGPCEADNAGDPIVLYDQIADRWLLTQFTDPRVPGVTELFNCIALSTTPDPTGTYFRWAISNGASFPDYPKYGVGRDAYFISTRDFDGPFVGLGIYAMNKAEMIAGNPNPTVIKFFVDNSTAYNVGDGILPMDIDGTELPAAGSAHYFIGSMDNGGPYAAPQDALTLWKFIVDFATPVNSSFALSDTIPIAPFDTIFPCNGGRNCIDQPDTTNGLDIQSYRQRPIFRLAYRKFATHESLVTNQSVESSPGIAGIRWWEVRSPDSNPIIYQEGTYGPGATDGIHRWMGSAAMDSAGNIGLAYSASSSTVFPSIFYTGRLATDILGLLPQGEASIHDGTGSQTGGGSRWGDYSSLNIDPNDDCTFWYINEYLPMTSAQGWQLRVGSFKFDECGSPGFSLSNASPPSQSVCVDASLDFDFSLGSVANFNLPVTLSVTGVPAAAMSSFSPNPVPSLPGSSTLTLSNFGGVSEGNYPMQITGTTAGADPRTQDIQVNVFETTPLIPSTTQPSNLAIDVRVLPAFAWTDTGAEEYTLEVASDSDFNNLIYTRTITNTTIVIDTALDTSTQYFWRVKANNACGDSSYSTVFSFTTEFAPGECAPTEISTQAMMFDFESGDQGWTHSALQGNDTWTLSMANPNTGLQAFNVIDVDSTTDQLLVSPTMNLSANLSRLTLQFWNDQQIEANGIASCWDGGLLEVSTDGGATFNQIQNSDLLTNPYTGPLSGGPLVGQNAWCGDPQPYLNSIVDISALAGQSVMFRFRMVTDVTVGRVEGWTIDDIQIQGCLVETIFSDSFEN